ASAHRIGTYTDSATPAFKHRSTQTLVVDRYHSKSLKNLDIADSTLKSIDVSSCYPDQKVGKEITMEDFLELEEFLELEDGQQLGDLDSSEEVTMEDFLELEEWLEDLDQNPKQKPPICAEEAVGICKRVKKIHDPVQIMVPCAVFEVESPIPPDIGVYLSSYI
ncbi:hypothetical protein HID58_090550, partial [Brassica napus]